jgi:hypothetical protein
MIGRARLIAPACQSRAPAQLELPCRSYNGHSAEVQTLRLSSIYANSRKGKTDVVYSFNTDIWSSVCDWHLIGTVSLHSFFWIVVLKSYQRSSPPCVDRMASSDAELLIDYLEDNQLLVRVEGTRLRVICEGYSVRLNDTQSQCSPSCFYTSWRPSRMR